MTLPREVSVFSAQVFAIDMAFQKSSGSGDEPVVIFTVSYSVFQCLQDKRTNNTHASKIQHKIHSQLIQKPIDICWVPALLCITGNEKTDNATESAASQQIQNQEMALFYKDLSIN